MSNFSRITSIDVSSLVAEIGANPQLWNSNPARLSKRGPHHECDDIFIRSNDERPCLADPAKWLHFSDVHAPLWYHSVDLLPSAKEIALRLMSDVGAEMVGGIYIYRLRPGAQVYPHIDTGWHPEFFDKFNVCLSSNQAAAFCYDEDRMVQSVGDIHWFRNDITHWVENKGESDHVVMIVCLRVDRGERVPPSPYGWTIDKQLGV